MSRRERRERISPSNDCEERNKNRVRDNRNADLTGRGPGGPPNIEGMTSLKVDNITQRTGVNLLKKIFIKYGDLGDIYVPRYPDTFASRGFAFVRFLRKKDAEEAMRKMNGHILDGRPLSIQMARYSRPMSDPHFRNGHSSRSHRNSPRRPQSRRPLHSARSQRRSSSSSRSRSRDKDRSSRNTSPKRSRRSRRSRSRSSDSNRSNRFNDRTTKRSKSRSTSNSDAEYKNIKTVKKVRERRSYSK